MSIEEKFSYEQLDTEEFEHDFRETLSPEERARFVTGEMSVDSALEYSQRLAYYIGEKIYQEKIERV